MEEVHRNERPLQLMEKGILPMNPTHIFATQSVAASSSSTAAATMFKSPVTFHHPFIPTKSPRCLHSKPVGMQEIKMHYNSNESTTRTKPSIDRSFPLFSPTSMLYLAAALTSPAPMTDATLTASILSLAALSPFQFAVSPLDVASSPFSLGTAAASSTNSFLGRASLTPHRRARSSFVMATGRPSSRVTFPSPLVPRDAPMNDAPSTRKTPPNRLTAKGAASSIPGSVKYLRWSELEDETLKMAILETTKAQPPFPWKKIVQTYFPDGTRTQNQCRSRWMRKLDPNLKGGQWTDAEDALLLTLRRDAKLGFRDIAAQLTGRRVDVIRERYQSFLDPLLRKDPWELAEKAALFEMVESVGPKWKSIAPQFPGRSEASCRNTWFNKVQSEKRSKRRLDEKKEMHALVELRTPKKKKRRRIDKDNVSVRVPLHDSANKRALKLIEAVAKHKKNEVPVLETESVAKVNVETASTLKKGAGIPMKKRNVLARIFKGVPTPDWTEGITNVVEL
jgi:hypothetical protein